MVSKPSMQYIRTMAVQIKRGGTRLTTIRNHVIWMECACGRAAPVRVADLLAAKTPPETVAEVVERVRCSGCGVKSAKDFRIVYEPAGEGAFNAMRGAAQHRDD
jgi:hypothetical protein